MAASNLPTPRKLKGYNLLANFMAKYSDMAIYRRFMSAHHFDLMLQQAELNYLLIDLSEAKKLNMESSDAAQQFDTYLKNLIQPGETSGADAQWQRLMQVRSKLKEYSDHLLQVASLLRLPAANMDDSQALRDWLNHPEGGADFQQGFEVMTWAAEMEHDLTSLNGHGENQDRLSRWIEGSVLTWLNSIGLYKLRRRYITIYDPYLEAEVKTRMDYYSDKVIRRVVSTISVSLAALLPATSIFVLFFVHSQLVRLGLIIVYTMFFSVVMSLVTPARTSECFAASAAFAAVLVVFVGSDSINKNVCSTG